MSYHNTSSTKDVCETCSKQGNIHLVSDYTSFLSEADRILLHALIRKCRKMSNEKLKELGIMLSKERGCSLRVIDTFCSTNLASHLYLYSVYKQKVNTHGKKQFDCFAREKKICICILGKEHITAVRQLNFMIFYVQYGIADALSETLK
jgi:hypothetical protein